MPFDITNPRHVSRVIDRNRAVAASLAAFRLDLMELTTEMTVNNVSAALAAPGVLFPPGFSITPAILNSARNTLTTVVQDAITAAITSGQQTNLDRVRLDIGVLLGTG